MRKIPFLVQVTDEIFVIIKQVISELERVVCFCTRSKVCGEEESSSPSGDDQRGLSADYDGQQQRRYTHCQTCRCFLSFSC